MVASSGPGNTGLGNWTVSSPELGDAGRGNRTVASRGWSRRSSSRLEPRSTKTPAASPTSSGHRLVSEKNGAVIKHGGQIKQKVAADRTMTSLLESYRAASAFRPAAAKKTITSSGPIGP